MKKLSLILLAFVLGCNDAQIPQKPVESPEVSTPDQVQVDLPEVVVEAKPIATITEYINHTAFEKERNIKAMDRVRETLRGECFQKALLDRALIQTGGKTTAQVLNEIINGDVKVKLSMYRSWKNTVGYTYAPPYDIIHCNRKYHDKMDPCDVGANLAHEITHKMGYTHDVNPNKQRPFSVPYSVGTLVDQCCQEKR